MFLALAFLLSCEEPAWKLTVSHRQTGLVWTRCSLHEPGEVDTSEDCTDSHWAGEWKDAVSACEELVYAGYDDWRLPNIRELQSIVIYDKLLPAIDETQFPGTHMYHYWSSTSYGSDLDMSEYAYVIDFMFGNIHIDPKDYSVQEGESSNYYRACYVRCVRGPDN